MLRGPKHKNATILGKTIASFPLQGTYIQLGNYPPKSQAGKRRAEHYCPRPLFTRVPFSRVVTVSGDCVSNQRF
ncbi:hypothetical protein, partial [Rhodopirellula baltica]